MVQRIRRFSIGQTAKVMGILYALMGLIFAPIFLFVALSAPQGTTGPWGVGVAVVLPVLYGVFGFIFVALGCALYNWVAGWMGGIEVEMEPPSGSA